jgi:hypothetical protein
MYRLYHVSPYHVSPVSCIACIIYHKYYISPVSCIACIMYHRYYISPVLCITSIIYRLHHVSPVLCITSIVYRLYHVSPVLYIACIIYRLYYVLPVSRIALFSAYCKFPNEFSTERDLVLPLQIPSTFSLPEGHPGVTYVFFLVFPSLPSFLTMFQKALPMQHVTNPFTLTSFQCM